MTSDHDDETFTDGVPLPDEPAGFDGKGPSQAQLLVGMAEDQYRLIRADDGRTYAIDKNGPSIAIPLASKTGVRAKLAASLRRRTGQVASSSALADCINVLEGEASELDPQPVYLRMGPFTDDAGRGCVAVDMGTETGHVIVITPDGWRTDYDSPVIFRRSDLTHPLVIPEADGTLDGLRTLMNLSEEDYRLAIAWVVAAYLDIPHPLLLVQGEQGTAKSNLIRSLLSLIDPQPAADREVPGGQREWAIFARASWAFSFDNVTEIAPWFSNSLCKGVTGDSVLQRALHSDEDIMVFSFRRVMAMTTIGIQHALAGDLVDRMLMVEPEVIEVRRSEADVAAARATALPQALGAILDLVSQVLRILPDVTVEQLPRMADFARVLAALDQVTGWSTLPTYRDRVATLGMALIEGDVFAQALYKLAVADSPGGLPPTPWEGTAASLIKVLRGICVQHGLAVAELPIDARVLGRRIREVAPSLRKVGVDIRKRKSGSNRLLSVAKITTG